MRLPLTRCCFAFFSLFMRRELDIPQQQEAKTKIKVYIFTLFHTEHIMQRRACWWPMKLVSRSVMILNCWINSSDSKRCCRARARLDVKSRSNEDESWMWSGKRAFLYTVGDTWASQWRRTMAQNSKQVVITTTSSSREYANWPWKFEIFLSCRWLSRRTHSQSAAACNRQQLSGLPLNTQLKIPSHAFDVNGQARK